MSDIPSGNFVLVPAEPQIQGPTEDGTISHWFTNADKSMLLACHQNELCAREVNEKIQAHWGVTEPPPCIFLQRIETPLNMAGKPNPEPSDEHPGHSWFIYLITHDEDGCTHRNGPTTQRKDN